MKLDLINDFKEIIYIKLKDEFLGFMLNKAISKTQTREKLLSKAGLKYDAVWKYKKGKQFIQFKYLSRLSKIAGIPLEDAIAAIEAIKLSPNSAELRIMQPNLGIEFDNFAGGKVVAAFLADGYISNNGAIGYVNKNSQLRKEFLKNLKTLFKGIELPKPIGLYKGRILQLSTILRPIFNKVGVPTGKKVFNNPNVPCWILDSQNFQTIRGYLQQFFDDEAHVSVEKRMIDLPQSIDISNLSKRDKELIRNKANRELLEKLAPKQLMGLKSLLHKIGIKTNKLYPVRTYAVEDDGTAFYRAKWVLTLSNVQELKKFKEKVGFVSEKKQSRLEEIVHMPVAFQRKNKQIEKDVHNACKIIQNREKSINSKLLALEIGIGQSYAQKLLYKLWQKGKLNRIEKSKSFHGPNGDFCKRAYAKYQLKGIKNVSKTCYCVP